jgi:hypothetical protein
MKTNLLVSVFFCLIIIYTGSCKKDDKSAEIKIEKDKIINHSCTDLSKIPDSVIFKAISDLYIVCNNSWWHSNEIIDGLNELESFKGSNFIINENGTYRANNITKKCLRLDANRAYGNINSLEYPNDSAWYLATNDTLSLNKKINVVIWCWEGGVSESKKAGIDNYLRLMNQLEKDFPSVKFVYMTGHLDGSDTTDNLYQRNQQIRKYCIDNKKILYDFADIESYDPDGNYYGDKLANDSCGYDSNGDGKIDKNWARIWQDAHPNEWYPCGPDQTQPLNSNRKAYAAWWMFARIAGWEGPKE